jgi:pimeloyl-ACP methyl ester carboxylesterase
MEPLSLQVGEFTFGGYQAGPPNADLVILLHGFPQTARAWRHELQALAAAGFRAVAPHLRGYCETARPDRVGDYRLDIVAGDIVAIADSLLAERFHLVGHDVGGIVGWELACRHPDRLLTFTAASTPHLSPFAASLDDPTQTRIPPFDLFRRPPPIPETALLGNDAGLLRAGYDGLDPESIDVYLRTFGTPGALSAALNHFRAFDFTSWRELTSTPVPTLFIWGEDDPYLADATADATADHVIGPYRSERLAGVGHWVPELAADVVTRLLQDHLARAR